MIREALLRLLAARRPIGPSEGRFRAYFEAVSDGLLAIEPGSDGQHRCQHVSAEAARLLGETEAGLLGRRPREIFGGIAGARFEELVETCLRIADVRRCACTISVDGHKRILDVTCSPVRDVDVPAASLTKGVQRGVIVSLRDGTETRGLQSLLEERSQELRKSLESQAALFENCPDGLIVVRVDRDAAGDVARFVFLTLSPSCAGVLGIPVADLAGRNVREALAPPVGGLMERDFQLSLRGGGPIARSATYHLPVGARDLETLIVPLRDQASGQVDRLIACLRDVTERNELADELRQSQKLEAIGRVAAGVAHDFNNILQGLIGSLEMLSDEVQVGSSMEQYIRVAMRSADRGAYLTHHLLAYARKQTLQPRVVAVGAALEETRELLERAVGPLVRMDYDVRTPDTKMHLDLTQFTTAMLNLGVNASYAMPRGGVLTIECDTKPAPAGVDLPAGDYVVVAVVDTGVGMDADIRARAFEPFYTTKGPQGTGLGLAMVQGFLRQSGGEARIHSTQGVGTRVEMWLPLADAGQDEPAGSRGDDGHRHDRGRSGRILLVDDMTDVLVTTGAFLEAAGFTVASCGSGDDAIERLSQDSFDLLITDFAMPGLHGIALIEQARLCRPGLPAILITGYPGFENEAEDHQPAMVLAKPFRRSALLAAVAKLLGPATAESERSASANT